MEQFLSSEEAQFVPEFIREKISRAALQCQEAASQNAKSSYESMITRVQEDLARHERDSADARATISELQDQILSGMAEMQTKNDTIERLKVTVRELEEKNEETCTMYAKKLAEVESHAEMFSFYEEQVKRLQNQIQVIMEQYGAVMQENYKLNYELIDEKGKKVVSQELRQQIATKEDDSCDDASVMDSQMPPFQVTPRPVVTDRQNSVTKVNREHQEQLISKINDLQREIGNLEEMRRKESECAKMQIRDLENGIKERNDVIKVCHDSITDLNECARTSSKFFEMLQKENAEQVSVFQNRISCLEKELRAQKLLCAELNTLNSYFIHADVSGQNDVFLRDLNTMDVRRTKINFPGLLAEYSSAIRALVVARNELDKVKKLYENEHFTNLYLKAENERVTEELSVLLERSKIETEKRSLVERGENPPTGVQSSEDMQCLYRSVYELILENARLKCAAQLPQSSGVKYALASLSKTNKDLLKIVSDVTGHGNVALQKLTDRIADQYECHFSQADESEEPSVKQLGSAACDHSKEPSFVETERERCETALKELLTRVDSLNELLTAAITDSQSQKIMQMEQEIVNNKKDYAYALSSVNEAGKVNEKMSELMQRNLDAVNRQLVDSMRQVQHYRSEMNKWKMHWAKHIADCSIRDKELGLVATPLQEGELCVFSGRLQWLLRRYKTLRKRKHACKSKRICFLKYKRARTRISS